MSYVWEHLFPAPHPMPPWELKRWNLQIEESRWFCQFFCQLPDLEYCQRLYFPGYWQYQLCLCLFVIKNERFHIKWEVGNKQTSWIFSDHASGFSASVFSSLYHWIAVWISAKENGTRRQNISQMSIILVSEVGGSSAILLVKMVVITSMMVRFTVRLASK